MVYERESVKCYFISNRNRNRKTLFEMIKWTVLSPVRIKMANISEGLAPTKKKMNKVFRGFFLRIDEIGSLTHRYFLESRKELQQFHIIHVKKNDRPILVHFCTTKTYCFKQKPIWLLESHCCKTVEWMILQKKNIWKLHISNLVYTLLYENKLQMRGFKESAT